MSPTSDNGRRSPQAQAGLPPPDPRRQSWGSDAGHKTLDEVLSLDNPSTDPTGAPGMMRYPSADADNSERIMWSRWDTVVDGSTTRFVDQPVGTLRVSYKPSRRWLLIGYLRGMQIWDCTSLDAPKELLNLPDVSWGRIWQAAVLPLPVSCPGQLRQSLPLIGIVYVLCLIFESSSLIRAFRAKQVSRDPRLLIYSLRSHDIIKTISAPGLVSFSANNQFIVLVSSPPLSQSINYH